MWIDKAMADAAAIARRLREGDVTISQLVKQYRCRHSTVMRAILSQMTVPEWHRIRSQIMARRGIKGQFQKGRSPWNKAMKGIHLSPATEFKKRSLPASHKELGTISIRNDNGKPFRYIATPGPTPHRHKWIPYAKYLWQKENGPVPQGYFVVHVDGATLNDSPDNLRMVNRSEHLFLQMSRDPSMRTKCRGGAAKATKKRHRLNRIKKAKAAREAAKRREREQKIQQRLREQAEKEAREKLQVEQGKADLMGPVRSWWECIGCGFEFEGEPHGICPKCNGFRFQKIIQREVA